MISIINSGIGNVGSIKSMLEYLNIKSEIITTKREIEHAEKLILPGVGSYDKGVNKLKENDLFEAIKLRATVDNIPILGICLGMQLLLDSSEEGTLSGLGLIEGRCEAFKLKNLKCPHMGWNNTTIKQENRLITKSKDVQRFYFVHSYYATVCEENVLATTKYGIKFASAIMKNNIFGVQFHPEKSHNFGLKLFTKFNNI